MKLYNYQKPKRDRKVNEPIHSTKHVLHMTIKAELRDIENDHRLEGFNLGIKAANYEQVAKLKEDRGVKSRFKKQPFYGEWLKECVGGTEQEVEVFLHKAIPKDYISAAFLWEGTEKGCAYWEDINNQWLYIVEEIKNETI